MSRMHPAGYPIHDLLSHRWSPRAFSSKPVEPEKLRSIMEAARWAPSCFNEQPWRYLIARQDQPEDFAKMAACLVDANRIWAQTAPVLMIAVAEGTFAKNGKPNRHAAHDLGMASALMTVQATALGLSIHQMGGFDAEQARRMFSIPPSAEAVAAIALGYIGDPGLLPEDYRERELIPSTRRPLSEQVFSGQWGRQAPWLHR